MSHRWVHSFLVGALLLCLSAQASARHAAHVSGVVNLNEATTEQLKQLPGMSQAAAERIVSYRTAHRFSKAEELVRVKGFGKKRFEKLKPFLAVAGPTTLKRAG